MTISQKRADKAVATYLSAHRNKVEARRKRELAKTLQSRVESMVRENDIRAFAVVGIASDGQAYSLWDTGAILPMWAFADTVATILRKDIDNCGVEDDWRPNLVVKGS